MKNTKIEWADHTFNPWIGCTKVSSGCANCYADSEDAAVGSFVREVMSKNKGFGVDEVFVKMIPLPNIETKE